jgi:hypothetical protein
MNKLATCIEEMMLLAISYLLSLRVYTKEQLCTTNLCILFFLVKPQTLYSNGSRNFWIHGTGALGCLPQKLAIPRKNDSDLDQYGCLKTYNRAAVAFNTALGSLCDELSAQMKDATIAYTDLFPIKYDLVANHTKYGEQTKHVSFQTYRI